LNNCDPESTRVQWKYDEGTWTFRMHTASGECIVLSARQNILDTRLRPALQPVLPPVKLPGFILGSKAAETGS
jgi:chorismate-pyruvate lyase